MHRACGEPNEIDLTALDMELNGSRCRYKEFPQLEGKVEAFEVGTPMTNEHYLNSWDGCSYGLDHGPARWRQHWLGPHTPGQ